MSSVYVYAFVADHKKPTRIAGHRIEVADVHGISVVIERLARPPRISRSTLRKQHDLVTQLGRRYEAIVPVRFGAFVAEAELEQIVRERRKRLTQALERVRGHVQMTTRVFTSAAVGDARRRPRAGPGTDYLLERNGFAVVASPAVTALRKVAARFSKAERVERGRTPGAASLFHLVPRGLAADYRRQVRRSAAKLDRTIAVRVTGPWPPFAFVTELWT